MRPILNLYKNISQHLSSVTFFQTIARTKHLLIDQNNFWTALLCLKGSVQLKLHLNVDSRDTVFKHTLLTERKYFQKIRNIQKARWRVLQCRWRVLNADLPKRKLKGFLDQTSFKDKFRLWLLHNYIDRLSRL